MISESTKAMRKIVRSLADAKGRRKEGLFVAEGAKCVADTLGYFTLKYLFATRAWIEAHPDYEGDVIAVDRGQMAEMSSLSLAPEVLAVYYLPMTLRHSPESYRGKLVVALDRIQDPGNLGTIMRTADWMGIDTILASADTVDCFNPKCVQATMGAIARVKVIYGDLPAMLRESRMPVYGTFLGGENVYRADLPAEAIVVMGNEGRGISEEVAGCVTRRLLIPPYPGDCPTSESLNVATATAIILSQFRSRLF